jgi:hypothetical protein
MVRILERRLPAGASAQSGARLLQESRPFIAIGLPPNGSAPLSADAALVSNIQLRLASIDPASAVGEQPSLVPLSM